MYVWVAVLDPGFLKKNPKILKLFMKIKNRVSCHDGDTPPPPLVRNTPVRNKTLSTPFLKLKNKTLSRALALSLASSMWYPLSSGNSDFPKGEIYTTWAETQTLQMPGETRTGNLSGRFQIEDHFLLDFCVLGSS